MADVPVYPIVPSAEAAPIQGSPTGDQCANDGRVELNVQNRGAVDVTVTVLAQRQPSWPLVCPDYEVVVVAGGFQTLEKLPTQWFNDPAAKLQIRYSPSDAAPDLLLDALRNPDARSPY